MSGNLRTTILNVLPLWATKGLRQARSVMSPHARAEARGTRERREAYARTLSPLRETVAQGPFVGMKFPPHLATWGNVAPYLIGSYEEELHPHLERLIAKAPQTIINIGAAEGYYAIGLARRLPTCEVIAVDSEGRARHQCQQLAKLNGVEGRVHSHPPLSMENFRSLLASRTLVVCDCEGCELGLLAPDSAIELASVDLLVELHDFLVPGATELIVQRFRESHRVTLVRTRERLASPAVYPALKAFPEESWTQLLNEARPGAMTWVILEPKSGAS